MEMLFSNFEWLSSIIKVLKNLVAIFSAMAVSVSGTTTSVIGFTEGMPIIAQRRMYCYDNTPLLLGGYNYAPSYSDDEHIGYVKDAGLEFLITGVNEEFLDQCDRYGIGVIAKNYNAPAFYYTFTDEQMQKWLNISSESYKNHPCLWGDDLIDEPTSAEFGRISRLANSYYEVTDGKKIPYINLFPMYASAEQLGNDSAVTTGTKMLLPNSDYSDESIDRYKRHVSDYINTIDTDYISVDIYPYTQNESGEKSTSTAWLRNLDILAEACRETDRDLWVIVQSAGNILEGGIMRHCDDTYDISQQAYVSLAFGTKAVIYACYHTGWWDSESHLIDADGNRTDTYYAVQKVNNDLKAFKDVYGDYDYLGTYLVNEKKCAGQAYGIYCSPEEDERIDIVSKNGLITGCFNKKYGNGKAYIIANMEELANGTGATFTTDFPADATVTLYRKGTSKVLTDNSLTLWLDCGEGVFITVE